MRLPLFAARRLKRAGVRGNGVAVFDKDDVAGYELSRWDALPHAVANDGGVGGRHLPQRRQRLLRPRPLNVAHDCIDLESLLSFF